MKRIVCLVIIILILSACQVVFAAGEVITVSSTQSEFNIENKIIEGTSGAIQPADFDPSKYNGITVSTVKGSAHYPRVRVLVDAPTSIQLIPPLGGDIAYYNIVKSGYGPKTGFPLVNTTATVYVVPSEAGTFSITARIVDLDTSATIASNTFQIRVVSPDTGDELIVGFIALGVAGICGTMVFRRRRNIDIV